MGMFRTGLLENRILRLVNCRPGNKDLLNFSADRRVLATEKGFPYHEPRFARLGGLVLKWRHEE
jgi:hypothetical protein